jgi:hypothetical protein
MIGIGTPSSQSRIPRPMIASSSFFTTPLATTSPNRLAWPRGRRHAAYQRCHRSLRSGWPASLRGDAFGHIVLPDGVRMVLALSPTRPCNMPVWTLLNRKDNLWNFGKGHARLSREAGNTIGLQYAGTGLSRETITSESLRIEPELPTEDWTMPESANRYFRLIAPPGGFNIAYKATVLLSHPTENPGEECSRFHRVNFRSAC